MFRFAFQCETPVWSTLLQQHSPCNETEETMNLSTSGPLFIPFLFIFTMTVLDPLTKCFIIATMKTDLLTFTKHCWHFIITHESKLKSNLTNYTLYFPNLKTDGMFLCWFLRKQFIDLDEKNQACLGDWYLWVCEMLYRSIKKSRSIELYVVLGWNCCHSAMCHSSLWWFLKTLTNYIFLSISVASDLWRVVPYCTDKQCMLQFHLRDLLHSRASLKWTRWLSSFTQL